MNRLFATLLSLAALALVPAIASAQFATLKDSTESVTVVLAGAKTTVDATYHLLWTDSPGGPKVETGTTNGTNVVTLAAGVDGTAPKMVRTLVLYNGDTGSITATVNKKSGATSYPLSVVTLQVGDTMVLDGLNSLRVLDLNGQAKTVNVTNVISLPIAASTAAAGTTTTDAGVLPSGGSIYPTTAADGTKGVRVAAGDKVNGRTLYIGNGVSTAILKVYAPSGGTINGAAADAAFSSVSGKGVIITCLNSSTNAWLAW